MDIILEVWLRLAVFAVGFYGVMLAIASAVRVFVLPRSSRDPIASVVFVTLRRAFNLFLKGMPTFEQRDRLMALYAPIGLILLLPTWYILVLLGFMAMFWAAGIDDLYQAFLVSGSSLLTLGFATVDNTLQLILVYSEATIGLLLVALLIAYVPTIYTAFSRREFAVTRLEVRAGSPPSPIEFILRHHRLNRLDALTDVWTTWEEWFADIEESHTSLASLVFFRSPQPDKSWITAAGVVLDTAALLRSMVDVPTDRQADICIRAGYLALRRIADFFSIPYFTNPHFPTNPISIAREEFDAVYELFKAEGVPLKEQEQAWLDFAGWRVNYDTLLIVFARLTMAPYAIWSSDRANVDDLYNPRYNISLSPLALINPFRRFSR